MNLHSIGGPIPDVTSTQKYRYVRCGWCEGTGIAPLGVHRCTRCAGEGAILVEIGGTSE